MPRLDLFNNGSFQIKEYLNPHTGMREIEYWFGHEYTFSKDDLDEFIAAFIAVGNSDGKPSKQGTPD